MASNNIPENGQNSVEHQVVEYIEVALPPYLCDDFPRDNYEYCDKGHVVMAGNVENCWNCRMEDQERRRANEEAKFELYSVYLQGAVRCEEMVATMQRIVEEEVGAQRFRTLETLVEQGEQCQREMEARLKEWMEPLQECQVSSSAGPGTLRSITAAQQDLMGLYHGFNMIKKAEGYHCLCGQLFDDDRALFRHFRSAMAYHSGRAICICNVCGEKKRTCGGLRVHSRKKHKEVLQRLWRSARE